jgi:two-component system sensor histidine kinase/response regulator
MLKEKGYTVRPVPSGKLALQAVESIPPDLILLDINMPHMNGYDVCEHLKSHNNTRDIPVIFISALAETIDKVRAFGVGGVDYITKPFEFEEVQARVEAHLALRTLRLQLESNNRRLEESLARQRDLEQIKERLVEMIVHDLNNPLAAITAYSHFLLNRIPKGSEVAEAVQDVTESALSMNRMVLNILDVMQLQERELQPRRSSVDLADLIESAVRTFQSTAQRAENKIEIKTQADVPPVSLDRDLMQRVLENLLENSLKYTPKGSSVVVEAGVTSDGEIAINTSDRGPGVPEDKRDQVFEVCARLERDQEADLRKSRGLGLAFCKMAVEAHGGRIWIDNNEPQGAVFCIRLPSGATT